MRIFIRTLTVAIVLLVLTSCGSTKELTIKTIEPSPVDFSTQIKKIGIVNYSKSSFVKGYSTRLEQLIVMEERWLAEKGTEAALTGLFDELAQDQRFEAVSILENSKENMVDLGTQPSNDAWKTIETICEENGVDALFALASHETETQFKLKKTKIDQRGMMRDFSGARGQEITLKTLIENGWRIYDPKQRMLVDEFTSNNEIIATAKGRSPVDALQAIDHRRETLLEQSTNSGNSYAQRMQPKKLEIQRDYYVIGSQNFKLAYDKIQNGEYKAAEELWQQEIANPKSKLSGWACYNIAVLHEFKGEIDQAMNWANKSYDLYKQDVTLDYISALEIRQAQTDILKQQLANTSFED